MRAGLGEFRRDLRQFANEVDHTLHDIENKAYEAERSGRTFWDRITRPFSYNWGNVNDLTFEMDSINDRIRKYNGKSFVACALVIIGIVSQSFLIGLICGCIAAAVVSSNFDQKDQLQEQINSLGSRYRIYGGTFSFFGLFVKTISHNVDRYGDVM